MLHNHIIDELKYGNRYGYAVRDNVILVFSETSGFYLKIVKNYRLIMTPWNIDEETATNLINSS